MQTPPAAAVPTSLVTVASYTPPKPAAPAETPPGGKFGIAGTDYVDGEMVRTIRYVNAHGAPFTDDPAANLRNRPE